MEEQTTPADSPASADAAPRELDPFMASAPPRSLPTYSWVEWIRQGLRAATLRSVHILPEGPGAWSMLLIVAVVTVIVSGASRLEVDDPASFDLRSWLFSFAPDAFLIFGVWLVLNWAREKTTHASPVAAWYLLVSIAMLPISLTGVAVGVLESRGYMPQ